MLNRNRPLLDEATLPDVSNCGVNVPSPDMLTPQRSAASIWTWAPSHPFVPLEEDLVAARMRGARWAAWVAEGLATVRRLWARLWRKNEDARVRNIAALPSRGHAAQAEPL